MKIHLKRIIKFDEKPSQPDYETFFIGNKDILYHGIGYLKPLTSDITLTIEEADLTNKHTRATYVDNWRDKLKKKGK